MNHDAFLDALAGGEGTYLACPEGHASLPPRRACPECGASVLTEQTLPESGEIATYTEVQVATPDFAEDAPYVTAIAEFGPVRLTGLLRGVDAEDVDIGDVVGVGVEESVTTGERIVVFRPR